MQRQEPGEQGHQEDIMVAAMHAGKLQEHLDLWSEVRRHWFLSGRKSTSVPSPAQERTEELCIGMLGNWFMMVDQPSWRWGKKDSNSGGTGRVWRRGGGIGVESGP